MLRPSNPVTAVLFLLMVTSVQSAVLPEDRTEALYHRYEGGGMVIDGPSVLVRKAVAEKFSVSANYYIDNVSAASIDVLANASPYIEKRNEYTLGLDYLTQKTTVSTSFTNSTENDYEANTAYLGVSQDFFGDLSSLNIGYAKGWDTVGKRGDLNFEEHINRHNFKVDWTQVLTKNWIASIGVNTVTDEGYLNNPYRVVRILDPSTGLGFRYQTEVYPETRTTTAVAIRTMYYLPYRASIKFEARKFGGTWGIESSNYELAYIHPYGDHWIFEGKFRSYSQTEADFYRDLIDPTDPSQNTQFVARDKEMSAFSNISYGFGVSYEKEFNSPGIFKKFGVTLNMDFFSFEFDNFRNVLVHDTNPGEYAVGQEPLYAFDATVTRLFFSIWY
ncbi:MAG: DUF3570 domain-containing protein [Gammaproteobacteria bacterium]|nr:DUF3570 domain-containing protein [Gammaproteobacteria bacterium]